MAKGNSKVCESENDSDDELDPNEFANLINEYTSVIKREKGKVKLLESTHAKLELAHSDLLGKCNTRFIKGHKPSNHIRARIKSHVYTTERTVYHSTYHVKDIIKRIRMYLLH